MWQFYFKRLMCFVMLSCTLMATTPFNAESTTERINVETLTSPKQKDYVFPDYPRSALSEDLEGWVQLHAMVSPEGKPYDIVVEDAFGHPSFTRAAIKAFERTRFFPGTFQGKPVDSVHTYKVSFSIETGGVKNRYFPAFKPAFHRVIEAVRTKEQQEANARLDRLSDLRKTLYEDALYWTAKFYVEREWGTPSDQLSALNRAIAYESDAKFLEESLFAQMVWSQLQLQLNLRYYRDAAQTIDMLVKHETTSQDDKKELLAKLEAIEALKASDKTYEVDGLLDKNGNWSYKPLRNKFAVVDVDGVLNEYAIYCQKDLLRFAHKVDFEYTIDGTNGECLLHAVGKPNTTFTYLQR